MTRLGPLCSRLCVDDLCRGNPDYTLCGGSYCYDCHKPKVEDGYLCEECSGVNEEEDFYDEADEVRS